YWPSLALATDRVGNLFCADKETFDVAKRGSIQEL
ncbi:uncharacterized protein METZ01_LOCUS234975, partial [marine metagenome]